MKNEITYKQIGIIRTPFSETTGMPVQSCAAQDTGGIVELDDEYATGLFDLEGFSHIILLYHFHLVKGYKLYVVPFMDDKPHGIFATRSPARPNPVGISIVELKKIEGRKIYFDGADMVDETPLIDIKPFFGKYDNRENARLGWLGNRHDIDITSIKSDGRFGPEKITKPNRCK